MIVGFVWVGDMAEARAYLERFRRIGTPQGEEIAEMRYVDLQSSGDERHHHGLRRYSAGHYLTEFSDAAIDAFLARGIAAGRRSRTGRRCRVAGSRPTAARSPRSVDDESAFSHRDTLVEFFAGSSWADPAEDDARMAGARRLGRVDGGVLVRHVRERDLGPGEEGVSRAYGATQLDRLAALKRTWDPDNVFHLNQNIRPAPVGV